MPRTRLLATLLLIFLSSPALGYVVFLKDGSQLQTREKYSVDGDQAILVLRSGVVSSIPLAEIDVERTERENRNNLDSVRVLEGLEDMDQVGRVPPPPPPTSLSDVLRQRQDRGLRLPEPRRRKARVDSPEAVESDQEPRTPAGHVDLARLPREPYDDDEVAEQLRQYFRGQGFETVNVHRGTQQRQPLVEMLTVSEPLVFKALEESASALLQIREQLPDRVEALELLLVAELRPNQPVRAGQFQLTPELAELLVGGRISPPAFFMRYVEF